ncbi:hypothetical protein Pmar_PMAR017174 [Perkinsus marinus ATCC 50983]|uniref:Transmembrane protein n=1 Tax=Perkinsus marinus (strain ATCC 50983 / TXsc) TaxID=423536 RepID=C5LSS4_PERM5|nr:hypothetical protein Pmar_PMAR017174 [Perkinsus marinus ATCC 50983]EER00315.1 hypothetical protein Pmar_PMAR017174 [Perkinsus marinus ATCC 50983]|eukprot:XP_002767597.1 hypothetical protein Pmar_PMAR017174 [Perkinsus marinus ATCC 50983]
MRLFLTWSSVLVGCLGREITPASGGELQHLCPPGFCLHYPSSAAVECVPVDSLITEKRGREILPALPLPPESKDQRRLALSGMHSIRCLPTELIEEGIPPEDATEAIEAPSRPTENSWLLPPVSPVAIILCAVVGYVVYHYITNKETASGRTPVEEGSGPAEHLNPPKERLAYLDRLEADATRIKASHEWQEKEAERRREETHGPRPHKGDTVNRASRGFWDGGGGGGELPSYRPTRKGPGRG